MKLTECRIVVTGGNGFLGQYVVRALREHGATKIVVPRSAQVDLTDGIATRRLFDDARPDLVIHLAAKVGGIGANRRQPGTFFRDNLLMGVHVIEEARRHETPKVVVTGTICSYPKLAPIPFREDEIWNGYPEETNAPYGIAKKALLVMAQAYRREFGLNAVVLFPVNLYGPGDGFDLEDSHVVPAMIRKFCEARSRGEDVVTLWGDGSPTREFLYVADAAEAVVLAAEHYDDADPVNVGGGSEISMKDLANLISDAVGYRGTIAWDTTKPNGQPRRFVDASRAKERFGFSASVRMSDGLARTIAWYIEHERASSHGQVKAGG